MRVIVCDNCKKVINNEKDIHTVNATGPIEKLDAGATSVLKLLSGELCSDCLEAILKDTAGFMFANSNKKCTEKSEEPMLSDSKKDSVVPDVKPTGYITFPRTLAGREIEFCLLYRKGLSTRCIAKEMGVSIQIIYRAIKAIIKPADEEARNEHLELARNEKAKEKVLTKVVRKNKMIATSLGIPEEECNQLTAEDLLKRKEEKLTDDICKYYRNGDSLGIISHKTRLKIVQLKDILRNNIPKDEQRVDLKEVQTVESCDGITTAVKLDVSGIKALYRAHWSLTEIALEHRCEVADVVYVLQQELA